MNKDMLLLVFLISLTCLGVSAVCPGPDRITRNPLVTFGELKELPYEQELRKAYDIEQDLLNPGGFLISNQHSVATISQEGEINTLAGSASGSGYDDGVGGYAGFFGVLDMAQINDGSKVIIVDGNQCVRKLDRSTNKVTTIAGRCGADQVLMNTTTTAREAEFMQLSAVIADEEKQELFYLCSTPEGLLARHDLKTDKVEPLIWADPRLSKPTSLVFDSAKENIYITQRFGIVKYNLNTSDLVQVAGSNASDHTNRPEGYETRDGSLFEARFGDSFYASLPASHDASLRSMVWLIPDKVLLVADTLDNSLKVVDLVKDLVSTVCEGCGNEPVLGNSSVCMVSQPETLSVIDGIIYVGNTVSSQDSSSHGVYLSLSYSQPICKLPIHEDTNLLVTDTQPEYRYGETIQYSCREGFELTSLYNSSRCVEQKEVSEKLAGVWEKPIPKCQPSPTDEMIHRTGGRPVLTGASSNGSLIRFNQKLIFCILFVNTFVFNTLFR